MSLNKVVVVAGTRVPFVRSFTHYKDRSNQNMLTHALKGLVAQMSLQGEKIDEVALGAVMKHAGDWNLARECVLGSGLSPETPAYDIQRACGTSLEGAIQVANKIALGQADVAIAGGSDTNSDLPLELSKSLSKKFVTLSQSKSMAEKVGLVAQFRPSDFVPKMPTVVEPRTGKSMGQHCELMAKEWGVTREEQDQLAFESHQKGAQAYEEGFYNNLVVPYEGAEKDTILRPDTSLEKLAKLRPAFDKSDAGTLTAGNSTTLTDGASCVLLASEDYARKKGWPILARFVDAQASAVDFVGGEGLLMAPAYAVSKMLQRQEMKLQDFSFYEIHEAFAAQALCTLKAWEDEKFCRERLGLDAPLGSIDRSKLNTKGGSVALGHPFAATGGRIVATLGNILSGATAGERGLISVCTGGGMGVTAILESC